MQQKQLILLKTTSHPEAGHLYEHLFISQVRHYFAQRQLYAHLDYHIEGWTYGKGVIYLIISLYTPDAISHAKRLPSLDPLALDEKTLADHLYQITAENRHRTEASSHPELLDELARLSEAPWQSLDSLGILNLQDVHHESDLLVETKKSYKPSDLILDITATDEKTLSAHPELLALFHQLSWLLMHNYIAALCSQTGVYSAYDDFLDNGASATLSNTFYCDEKNRSIDEYSAIIQETTDQIIKTTVLQRFIGQLHANSYERGDLSRPDDLQIYQDTGLFVGQRGWREIATAENINHLLEKTTIDLKLKKQHSTMPILPVSNSKQ